MPQNPKIFLSYAKEDVADVQKIYRSLEAAGFAPWMDKENLLPGQEWDLEIRKSLRESDFVIAFLSKTSVSRRGYIQKEFKLAIDVLSEMPSGRIFLIPVKLDDCEVPEMFKHIQWINFFEDNAFAKIETAINSTINKQNVDKESLPLSTQIPGLLGEKRESEFASKLGESTPVKNAPKNKSVPLTFRAIYDYFTYHSIATIALTISPLLWLLINNFFGEEIRLTLTNGQYTSFSKIVFAFLLFISFSFITFRAIFNRYDETVKQNGQFVLFSILDSVNSADFQRYKRAINIVQQAENAEGVILPLEITNPRKQLEILIGEMLYCFSSLFGIKRSDISANIAFRIQGGDWQWFIPSNADVNFSKHLLVSSQSTIHNLINKNFQMIFFPDKRRGKELGQYLESERDIKNNGIGSILCYDTSVELSQTKRLEAILSVSTYGYQMCLANDTESKSKITRQIIPTYANRIRTELAMIYINEVLNKQLNDA